MRCLEYFGDGGRLEGSMGAIVILTSGGTLIGSCPTRDMCRTSWSVGDATGDASARRSSIIAKPRKP